MIQFKNLYYTTMPDCDENEGGLFIQVYDDENFENEVDYFVIDKKHVEKHIDEEVVLLKYLNGELDL